MRSSARADHITSSTWRMECGSSIMKVMDWRDNQYVYFAPFKLNDGSKSTGYFVSFSFFPQYINEEVDFIQADFDLSEIVGLKDVKIVVNSFNQNTGVANVTLQTD